VSAAGSAHLALVPPAADAPLSPPLNRLVRSAEAKRASLARARRVLLGAWGAGCALVVGGPLLAPSSGDASLAGLLLGGALLLPMSGLALGGLGLYERSRDAVSALMLAALALASTIALFGPAHRAAVEMHVAANEQELDAVAAEVRALVASVPMAGNGIGARDRLIEERFGPRLHPLGLQWYQAVEGGLLFVHRGETGYMLLYADGAAGPPDECRKRRLRFLGGRWYHHECGYEND
jgi:hypothetical protein